MWNDRIDLMVLVQECLAAKHDVPWALLVDTLIAKGYHRCDKDERKKMDEVDRKADEVAVMRLRLDSLRGVTDQFADWAFQFEEGSPQRKHYTELALSLGIISAEYAGLTARIAAKNGVSQ